MVNNVFCCIGYCCIFNVSLLMVVFCVGSIFIYGCFLFVIFNIEYFQGNYIFYM